jgi:hypothetical protein
MTTSLKKASARTIQWDAAGTHQALGSGERASVDCCHGTKNYPGSLATTSGPRYSLWPATSRCATNSCFASHTTGPLRREEVCTLESGDLDPSHREVRIRAEVTKSRRERLVRYTPATGQLLRQYLSSRRSLGRSERLIFLSESRRNRGHPISIWAWSKTVAGVARRAGLPRFTTHTPRHLRLTDLARAGMDIHDIAAYAGHRSIQTTLLYIHLSGRELASKYDRAMEHIKRWRAELHYEELD